ncbi:MAG: signal peptidase II [Gemmatales bacterium]|nr:signal peptidase II [Gemmatales bacterium]MDW8387556.1 signal peptidase II [Gemmatales bacterium]
MSQIPQASKSFHWLFWTLALAGLTIDLTSKYGVNAWLDQDRHHIHVGGFEHKGYEIIPGMFSLVRQEGLNRGALFGIGNHPEHGNKANLLFAGISAAAAVLITLWSFRRGVTTSWVLSVALGLILAGALGNLYDRLVFGGVRDFIWVYYQSAEDDRLLFNYPVFNLADAFLCVGAALLVLHTFFASKAGE